MRYFEILARSKVALNCHIDCAENDAGNMRLYEATGMGACLVTDWKHNLKDLFEPDVELVPYHSVDECIEKVQYLLAHDGERQTIAAAGQRRVLRDHTCAQRVLQFDQLVQGLLSRYFKGGPA
jgi:spore maturation protein CgeB